MNLLASLIGGNQLVKLKKASFLFFILLGIALCNGQPVSERGDGDFPDADGVDDGAIDLNRSSVYPNIDADFVGPKGENRPLKFASFNIQIFGKKKMQQEDIVDVLIKILLRYDLILIQEIRDSEEKWTQELLNVLNGKCHHEDKYQMILSDRLGRSSSKEQYGFFYRTRLLEVKGSFHYDDGEEVNGCISPKEKEAADKKAAKMILLAKAAAASAAADGDAANGTTDVGAAEDGAAVQDDEISAENETDSHEIRSMVLGTEDESVKVNAENETRAAYRKEKEERPICIDEFQREPFIVRFYSKTTVVKDFSVIACHTDPNEAVKEIDALYDVYKKVKSRYGSTEVIIAGDLNAGGAYMPKKYWPEIRLRNMRYWDWLIPDNTDTTTGNSDAAYDRFVISRRGKFESGGIIKESVGVFDFQKYYGLDDELTKRVSDHYPIELQMLPDNN